jgi:hypothetical protein
MLSAVPQGSVLGSPALQCVQQYMRCSIYSLLTISKFTEPLILLRTAVYFSLILTLYKVGALLNV